MPYSVVDLFAGAGGLSLGFVQTGKYEIKVAFEREPHMQATYHRNHPTVELQGDVCGADYADIQRRHGAIDVVIGGPPCQGFSNANRQKNHAISQNNMLVKQYIRAIRELQPKAFVMENVSMLRSDVHRFYMEETDLDIVEEYQIPNKNTPLHLLSSEFVFDGALEIVQNLELLQQRLWPENHYRELNIIFKGEKNADKMKKSLEKHRRKLTEIAQAYIEDDADNYIAQKSREAFQAIIDYFDGILEADRIHTLIEPAIMIQRMLSKAKEIFDKQYIRAIRELQPKAFVMENVSMLRSDVHRFYMEETDLDIVEEYQIPNKNTPLHLLSSEFVFDGALEIVQNLELLQQRLWPENHYRELNIIFKGEKNADKMKKSLEKHRRKLTEIAQAYIEDDADNYIAQKSREAFQAIIDYFDGILEADRIHTLIEPAIMIQRMLSKAKEIFDNHIHVDSYECTEKDGLLANIRSFAVFDYLKSILTSGEDGYVINSGVLCAADFGAPQKRERFVVMGIKKSISAVVFLPSRKIKDGHYKTVHDAIYDLEDVPPVYDLADDEEGIPLEHKEQLSSVAQQLRDSDILKNHIITKTTDVAMARFKALHQGENFHSLEESLKTNTYTDVKRTQNTIYLRLNYNEPSGTVLNVRKSMWIHPTLDRAISIREAARLQTFPDSFVFCGSKDKQYQQVGNAVPPIMAKAIAKQLAATLGKKLREAEQENG